MSDLISATTAAHYAAHTTTVINQLAHRLRTTTQPFSGQTRTDLQTLIDNIDLNTPGTGTTQALAEIDEIFTANAIWFHHPAYQAHLNCPVALPAVAAEAILACVNTSLDTYDQSTIGTFIERRLITWTCERIGFNTDHADGVFTSGGSQSNLQGLLLAREHATTRARELHATTTPQRPFNLHEHLERMVILATTASHFSVEKSARLLGLTPDAVINIPLDTHGRMDPTTLPAMLHTLQQTGRIPIAVVATAGTTDRGCIDPLTDIGPICTQANIWLHVDAAYGGGLLVSPTKRHLLNGIEHASSVTIDYHKTFFQPVSSSAILVRSRTDLTPITWHADYLNPLENDEPNQVDKSLQTTRRFDALKLWATLRAMGPDTIGTLIDRIIDLTQEVHTSLHNDPDFEVIGTTDLTTVLFRYTANTTPTQADNLVPTIRRHLFDTGQAIIAKTIIDNRPCLKLTLLNPDTTLTDVNHVINLIRTTATTALAAWSETADIEAVGARQ